MIKDSKKEDNIVAIATDINQEVQNTQENKTIAEAPALAADYNVAIATKNNKAQKKRISFLDVCGEPEFEKIDKLCYDFLTSEGFDLEMLGISPDAEGRLLKDLSKKNLRVGFREALKNSNDDKAILVWFVLVDETTNKTVATSRGIKFVSTMREVLPNENDSSADI